VGDSIGIGLIGLVVHDVSDERISAIHCAVEIVGEGHREHPTGAIVLGPAEVEARLHAARPLDRHLRLRQVDLVRSEDQLRLRRERVGELEVDRRPPAARSISVVSEKRTSIRPVSAAMVGSAPSINPSSRMVSIFSRLFKYVTEPPVRFPTGEPARLIGPWNWLMRLKVRVVGVLPWVVPNRVSPCAMALIVAAAGPDRVNSSAIELCLTPACRKNAGTLGMPTAGRRRPRRTRGPSCHRGRRERVAEQAGQPRSQVARVDRHHNVALVVDDVLEGASGSPPGRAPGHRSGPARCRGCTG
jgi:hypothetical protein